MTERDPHRCASVGACVNADTGDTDPDTGKAFRRGAVIIADDGPLCGGCYARLQAAIRYLPDDWLRLKASIGDRFADDGTKVHQSRTPGIPINTAIEALMRRIVEVAERAAEMVECELDISKRPDSHYCDPQLASIDRAVKRLDTTLDVLLDIEPQAMNVWGPIPTGDEGWDDKQGQPRELVEMDGVDVAAQIVRVNREVGRRLGKSYLRHHMAMPCPAFDKRGRNCGAHTVGRDDGAARINCTTCGASWTEQEYEFLAGLVLDEIQQREENDMLRWLLAEAYWRLDSLQIRSDALGEQWDDLTEHVLCNPPNVAVGVLGVVREQLTGVLNDGPEPHYRPGDPERQTTSPAPKRKRPKELTR